VLIAGISDRSLINRPVLPEGESRQRERTSIMRIKTHLGISADGYISSPQGIPTQALMPTFVSGTSHGHPEFIGGCGAVLMGRTTFIPALGAGEWPWPDLQVFVLTSSKLPEGTPDGVVTAADPADLLTMMRKADFAGDVHLVGGRRTVEAFRSIGALHSFGIVIMPIMLGGGARLESPGADSQFLRLESTRSFPDGSVEHIYTPAASTRTD
jgi:dihydrofolate reductase